MHTKKHAYKIQKIPSKNLDFVNFLHFWQILAVFCQKKAKKCRNRKTIFCCSIFFCWEESTYKISKNLIKWFGFCQFSSFFVNFCRFFAKKVQIRPKSKTSFFAEFYFVGKHLHTKFQKILSNYFDFANFLHLWSIFAVFCKKRPKNVEIEKQFCCSIFFCREA